MQISRREFFGRGALYGGSLWLALSVPRPGTWAAVASSTEAETFQPGQWRLVEAMTARIIPTDQDPGALEAVCVNFIDKALAHEEAAYRPLYEAGLSGVDAVAQERFGDSFTALSHTQQDRVLAALESGMASGWPAGSLSSSQFFEVVRVHTLIGFLADPRHGGNRDHVGWKTVGYPGPRHRVGGYTKEQMLGQQKIRAVWGEEI